jgi:hypothetical protein
MAFPLTSQFIAKCDKVLEDNFLDIKNLSDEEEQIMESLDVWKAQIGEDKVLNYALALYLNMKFMDGVLHSSIFHLAPLLDDHAPTSDGTLSKLATAGVFTTDGQCADENQKSYLNFAVAIKERTVEQFIDMLENLHNDGFSVTATYAQKHVAHRHIIFVDEGFKLNNRNVKIPDVKSLNKEALKQNPDFGRMHCYIRMHLGISLTDLEYMNSMVLFDKPDLFVCCIWNSKWELKQADEALLTRWTEFRQATV